MYRQTRGGGIKMFVRSNISANIDECLSGDFCTHEAIFVDAFVPNRGTIKVGGIYRAPSKSLTSFIDYLNDNTFPACVLMGDMNVDILKASTDHSIQIFIDTLISKGFSCSINKPTYFSSVLRRPTSCLDHIWLSIVGDWQSFVISPKLADHFPVSVVFNSKVNFERKIISFRDYSIGNVDRFLQNIELELSGYNLLPGNDVNEAFDNLNNKLLYLANKYFPVRQKSLSIGRLSMPWLTSKLLKCIDKKHKWLTLLKRGIITYNSFKTYSQRLRILLRAAENQYYCSAFSNIHGDQRKHWKLLNQMLGRQRSTPISKFIINGESVSSNNIIANAFNLHFNNAPPTCT